MRILVVEDDPACLQLLATAAAGVASVARAPVDVQRGAAADLDRAVDAARPDVVVLGPSIADAPMLADVLARLAARPAAPPALAVGARDEAAPAVAALRSGAAGYVVLRRAEDTGAVTAALGALVGADAGPRRGPAIAPRRAATPLAGLVGRSPAIDHVKDLVRTAARSDAHVLIEGETGTGKEVAARAIHALGRRAAGPFVPLNCAAVPEALAESEFFGHTRGAFTGAVQERPGVLHLADRGTLFLDEVEDLSPALQAKLLRVVQDREIRPLGASAARRVDARIVSASNRDLAGMVDAGLFRRDLFYRLRVLAIRLPPLRERRDDVPLLVEHFVARHNQSHGTRYTVPDASALRPLVGHPWPGNVRELENAVESLLVLAGARGVDLADVLDRQGAGSVFAVDERTRIVRVLDEHRWNRQRAAAALGISRVTLWRRMERHGIRDPLGVPAGETA
jgi:two-component system NtrC family response regulator